MSDLVLGLEFVAGAIISIIVISNPVSTSAMFVALTEGMSVEEKLSVARKSIRYSSTILVFFALTGLLVFQIFGFGVGAFRIAGGVLLFSTAVGMLNPKPRTESEKASQDVALIPLALPFISGPGTIVTVVVLMSEALGFVADRGIVMGGLAIFGVYLGIAVTVWVSYIMMLRSDRIDRLFGEDGRNAVTRLLGLLVMAISIQFVINGIKDLLPEFVQIVQDSGLWL